MAAVDETLHGAPLAPIPPLVVEGDELAARRSLRAQVSKIEAELAAAFVAAYPRTGIDFRVHGRRGPRLLSLGDLEKLRDDLAHRLREARRTLDDRAEVEARNRQLIENMLLEPGKYKWVRVANADIGEPGCKHWHVRPRLGLVGMLMGWWRVKISSGCPLAGTPRAASGKDAGSVAYFVRKEPRTPLDVDPRRGRAVADGPSLQEAQGGVSRGCR